MKFIVRALRITLGVMGCWGFPGHAADTDRPLEVVALPPLRIDGQPARAHTQGLELADGKVYVTARREDVSPRRALLLRTEPGAAQWDVWDLTPRDAAGAVTALDHPGGFQSDGSRLWIPLAESRRHGRSLVRAYRLKDFGVEGGRGSAPVAEVEFPVADHIGALAVSVDREQVFGASWDTETVYVWDFRGRLEQKLTGPALDRRGLGAVAGAGGRAGVTVQDWKLIGDRLFAAGLWRAPGSLVAASAPVSRLVVFRSVLEPGFERTSVPLPDVPGVELAREGMAVADGCAHFLPDDLGATNRLWRLRLEESLR